MKNQSAAFENKRRNCAILHSAPENTLERKNETVKRLLDEISYSSEKVVQSVRLGEKNEAKPRPIKVQFCDEAQKWDFMKRVNHAKPYGKVFAKLDLTKEELNDEFKIREKVKRLKTEIQIFTGKT